jgi:hypothetical protein
MAQVKELIQQHLGSGPILKALIQKMGFIPIIDLTFRTLFWGANPFLQPARARRRPGS